MSARNHIALALSSDERKGKIEISEGNKRSISASDLEIVFREFPDSPRSDCARFGYIEMGRNHLDQPLQILARKVNGRMEVELMNMGRLCNY